jgi:hypothetical protein
MDQFEQQEFWQGLNRLYLATQNLVAATEALRATAEKHESRLDKLEVVQQWLAERERAREKREQEEK